MSLDPALRPPLHQFSAVWDTGATNSVITQNVIDRCGLKPTGMAVSHGVHGSQTVETFLVGIMLPNGIGFPSIAVSRAANLGGGVDMLLGMDIITRGDFALTNVGGKSVFSFQYPSSKTIDFQAAQAPAYSQKGFSAGGPSKRKKKRGR